MNAVLQTSSELACVVTPPKVKAVLFDLDGTLVDSAPDLAATANAMREARGLDALPYAALRPMVGTGARGMVGVAFGCAPGDAAFDALRNEFLDTYAVRLLERTAPFADILPLLMALESNGLMWGIVTNKAARFADPLLEGLGMRDRARVVICGDTTPHSKPHPAPLLEAARRLGVAPADCVYVGDDLRDVQAGRAAGMATLAAGWGYLGQESAVTQWQADAVLNAPADLLGWLGLVDGQPG